MTRRIEEQIPELKQTSFVRISMDPLYDKLLKKPFPDSVSAIEYCRSVCAEFGFTVKQEASANRNIYVYCSREGLPDSQRNPKPSPQRKRPSKRCDCRWRVVLSENEHEEWEFRKSMNPNASEHNHEMMSPDEMVKAWPSEVNEMIIQLARQRLQTHEIREAVKQHFPDITWNERRFYNRLTEERKRIRQRGVIERAQRLLLLSARLCSVIANHEDWTVSVESDLKRMFENFCQMARLTPEAINTLVDLQPEKIHLETDRLVGHTHGLSRESDAEEEDEPAGSPTKKRKATAAKNDASSVSTNKSDSSNSSNKTACSPEPQKGIQMVHVPSYTIGIRSYSHRSNNSRYVYPDSPYLEQALAQHQQHQSFNPNTTFFPLASPTSSASSSSSVPFVQRIASTQMHSMTSPTDALHSTSSPTDFMVSSFQTQQSLLPHSNTTTTDNHDYNHINHIVNMGSATNTTHAASSHNTGGVTYSMPNSFPTYTMPNSTNFTTATAATDVPFSFEPMIRTTTNNTSDHRSSLTPHAQHEAFYNPSAAAAAVAVKEELNTQHLQAVDYALSSSRSFHSQTQPSYSLPMIRSNEEATAQWS